MMQWQVMRLSKSEVYPKETIQGILETFRNGFGLKDGWSPAEVHRALGRSSILALLKSQDNQIVGYAFFSTPEEPLLGKNLLWEDAICIHKNWQGKGLSTAHLFQAICEFLPTKTFGWLGGRTQNPVVILRYAHLGTLYPFDRSYADGEGKTIMAFLLDHIPEVKAARPALDLQTGICKRTYPEGRLGDYPIEKKRGEIYELWLNRWGFSRNAGDAVIVISQLSKTISSLNMGG